MEVKNNYKDILISLLLQSLIGFLFIIIPGNTILDVSLTLFGIAIVLINILPFIYGIMQYNYSADAKISFYSSLVMIIVGMVLIFDHNKFICIMAAIFFIIVPIIRILISNNKVEQLKKDIIKITIGVLVLIVGPWGIADVAFKILGIIIIVLALAYAAYLFIFNKKNKNKNGQNKDVLDAEVKELN